MNYELAKKLKDAGFPQEGKAGDRVFPDKERGDGTIENGYFIKCPTLSELIEACEGKMVSLISTSERNGRIPGGKEWAVTSRDIPDIIKADTPEEAVANLWLELRGK